MLIQVGELAKRAGVSVRTLHHYEQTGLLLPSARTAAGYRLYNLADVQRLHVIRTLAQAGLELAEIKDYLAQEGFSLTELLEAQINRLDKQMRSLGTLREQLVCLHSGLSAGESADLESWLKTLELMKMYDRWFTKEELKTFPLAGQSAEIKTAWAALVDELNSLMAQQVAVTDPQAMDLATRWMTRLEQDTAGKPEFLCRLNEMHAIEPLLGDQTGISTAMIDYVSQAFAESKLLIWQRYLSPREYAYTRAHYFDRMQEWPLLVSKLHQAVQAGIAPVSDEAKTLAAHWLALFESYAGPDPQTQAKFRAAMQQEPHLMKGTWMTPDVLQWLQQAIASRFAAG